MTLPILNSKLDPNQLLLLIVAAASLQSAGPGFSLGKGTEPSAVSSSRLPEGVQLWEHSRTRARGRQTGMGALRRGSQRGAGSRGRDAWTRVGVGAGGHRRAGSRTLLQVWPRQVLGGQPPSPAFTPPESRDWQREDPKSKEVAINVIRRDVKNEQGRNATMMFPNLGRIC